MRLLMARAFFDLQWPMLRGLDESFNVSEVTAIPSKSWSRSLPISDERWTLLATVARPWSGCSVDSHYLSLMLVRRVRSCKTQTKV